MLNRALIPGGISGVQTHQNPKNASLDGNVVSKLVYSVIHVYGYMVEAQWKIKI